jgi:hypothetical protein
MQSVAVRHSWQGQYRFRLRVGAAVGFCLARRARRMRLMMAGRKAKSSFFMTVGPFEVTNA